MFTRVLQTLQLKLDGWKMIFRCFLMLVSGSVGGFQTCLKISSLKERFPIRLDDDNCYLNLFGQIFNMR